MYRQLFILSNPCLVLRIDQTKCSDLTVVTPLSILSTCGGVAVGQDVVVEVDATSIGVGLDVERPRPLTKHSVACLSAGFAGSGIRQGQRGRACLRRKGAPTFPPFRDVASLAL